MLYILVNKEEYDCYTVDAAYPIELNSKEEFWAGFNRAKTASRDGKALWENSGFRYMGFYYSCNDELYASNDPFTPKLLTLEEWVSEGRKMGVRENAVYSLNDNIYIDGKPINNTFGFPNFIRTKEFRPLCFSCPVWGWEVEQGDEKGNWLPYDALIGSLVIKDNYELV